MKKVFIGIDFSKLKFDAVFLEATNVDKPVHKEFTNDLSGCKSFICWAKSHTRSSKKDWLVCGEATGIYTRELTAFLNQSKIDIWIEDPKQIKRSLGMIRGKTDKVDAYRIALYAYRFKDKAQSSYVRSKALDQIKDLTAYGERLKRQKQALKVSANELKRVKNNDSIVDFIHQDSESKMLEIKKTLKNIEKKIKNLINQNAALFENYELISSVKGIGFKNTIMILILTGNFSGFTQASKFGCYCGVVPFEYSSGSSVSGTTRISELANKKMKAFLTQAANSAVRHDKNLKDYYNRKLQDGKDHALIINNVRNKLIHIIFGVIKNRKPYDPNWNNTIQKSA